MEEGLTAGVPAPAPNEPPRRRIPTRQVIIGGATAIALVVLIVLVVRYQSGAEQRRYEKVLSATLDRLVTAQEGFYYDSTRYTPSLRTLPGVQLPAGVHVQIFNPDRRSWWGVATHERLPGRLCVVWVGTPPPAMPRDARAPEDETKPLCYDRARIAVPALPRS
jgi:hypothetical protein